ncbi:MAG: ADP-ribosylation factor-like protein, partial [Myxococcales bacterium]
AHLGAGLGHRFLKHMQRCRAMVHLVDASQDRDLLADYETIRRELVLFDAALGRKEQVVVANKIDVTEARERAEAFREKLARKKIEVHLISGVTGEGIGELLDAIVGVLDAARDPQPFDKDAAPDTVADEPRSGRLEDERERDAAEKRARRAKP